MEAAAAEVGGRLGGALGGSRAPWDVELRTFWAVTELLQGLYPHRPGPRDLPGPSSAQPSEAAQPSPPGQGGVAFPTHPELAQFFKNFYLFIFGERERSIILERENVWLPLTRPQLGTCPATQACAPTGNRTLWFTGWHSVH